MVVASRRETLNEEVAEDGGGAQVKGGALTKVELWSRSSGDDEAQVTMELWWQSSGDDEAQVTMELWWQSSGDDEAKVTMELWSRCSRGSAGGSMILEV